jgi:ribosomal protein L32
MANPKKRPSKTAKAAQKLIKDSKLLADSQADQDDNTGKEFRSSVVTPRTSTANKPRPHKKRG